MPLSLDELESQAVQPLPSREVMTIIGTGRMVQPGPDEAAASAADPDEPAGECSLPDDYQPGDPLPDDCAADAVGGEAGEATDAAEGAVEGAAEGMPSDPLSGLTGPLQGLVGGLPLGG